MKVKDGIIGLDIGMCRICLKNTYNYKDAVQSAVNLCDDTTPLKPFAVDFPELYGYDAIPID